MWLRHPNCAYDGTSPRGGSASVSERSCAGLYFKCLTQLAYGQLAVCFSVGNSVFRDYTKVPTSFPSSLVVPTILIQVYRPQGVDSDPR